MLSLLVEEIHIDGAADDAAIQHLFSPEWLAIIDAANADIEAGNGLTLQQLDECLTENRAAWLEANPS